MKTFVQQLKLAAICFALLTIMCGIVYPGIITGIAQLCFHTQANGSIVDNTGSQLIAQNFDQPQYLIGRPAGVTNLSPTSAEEATLVQERVDWWHNFDPTNTADIPADLVTDSGSGVDPDISSAAAEYQVARIANARNMTEDEVRSIIAKHTSGRFLGFIGEPSVNVLMVNLDLDGRL